MKCVGVVLTAIVIASCLTVGGTHAQTTGDNPTSLQAAKDTFIVKGDRAGHDENRLTLQSWYSGGNYKNDTRILLSFDVSSIPDDALLDTATVRLTLARPPAWDYRSGEATEIYAYRQSRLEWNESEADWYGWRNHSCTSSGGVDCWETPGGDLVYDPGVPVRVAATYHVSEARKVDECDLGTCTLRFDVADMVEDARLHRANTVSLAIRSESTGQAPVLARFYSSEHNEFGYRPTIDLTYSGDVEPTCPVDITFVVDNSGSMDDHNADINLKRLTRKLKRYFRDNASASRGTLYWFSRNGKGVRLIRYQDDESLRLSLEKMHRPTFDYDGSHMKSAFKEATDHALANANSGRAQFIFFAGDEQQDFPKVTRPADPYWRIIDRARRQAISYYTFALRPGPKDQRDQPYSFIDRRSNGPRDEDSRYFKGRHFDDNDALRQALRYDACKIAGTKFNDSNGNGLFEDTEDGLGGWQIRLYSADSPEPVAQTVTSNDSDRLGQYEFRGLSPTTRYWIEEVPTPQQSSEGWRQTTPAESPSSAVTLSQRMIRHVGNRRDCQGPCDDAGAVVTAGKDVSPAVVTGAISQTNVALTVDIARQPVSNLKITEQLTPLLRFARQSTVRATHVDATGNATPFDLASQPPAGTNQPWVIEAADRSRIFSPGTVTVEFSVDVTRLTSGRHAVDSVSSQCSQSSRVEYTDTSNLAAKCVILPPGSIERRNAAITILGDALFQDEASDVLFDGETLRVGDASLVVTGSLRPPLGSRRSLTGFDVPTSGPLSFQAVWDKLAGRIQRARETSARILPCPSRLSGSLYLQTDGPNLAVAPTKTVGPQVWIIASTCDVTLGDVTLVGRGTIVVVDGTVSFKGAITSQTASDTLAVISMSPLKDTVIYDQASPNNTVVVSRGKIAVSRRDDGVANSQVRFQRYSAYLLAHTLTFPPRGSLRADTSIAPATSIKQGVPPLLEQFTLPSSKFLQ